MARAKREEGDGKRRRPATTPEARELQITSAAYDLAEEQIDNGTASSQVITHFLKAGSMRERLEQQKIAHENELLEAKREALVNQQRVEELFAEAIDAMKSYSGGTSPETEMLGDE